MDYRYGSHTVFKIQYHFVFVTKYRYHVLKGDVALKTRELIRQTFCVTSGEVTEEMIRNYLEHHFEPKTDDNFRTE